MHRLSAELRLRLPDAARHLGDTGQRNRRAQCNAILRGGCNGSVRGAACDTTSICVVGERWGNGQRVRHIHGGQRVRWPVLLERGERFPECKCYNNDLPAQMQSVVIGQSTVLSLDDSGNGNYLIAQQSTLPESATIESLSFYVATASGKMRLGIYDSTGPAGAPGAKLAETAELTTTTVGWNSANVVSPVRLAAASYWLTYLSSDNNLHSRRTGSGGGASAYYVFPYGTLPAVFSTSTTSATVQWSFDATLLP